MLAKQILPDFFIALHRTGQAVSVGLLQKLSVPEMLQCLTFLTSHAVSFVSSIALYTRGTRCRLLRRRKSAQLCIVIENLVMLLGRCAHTKASS